MRGLIVKDLKLALEHTVNCIKEYIRIAEEIDVTNEQWFLDFEDNINALSILDHSKYDSNN